ncbi:MAG: hypothetical protein KAH48_11465 [Chlorobi bacterium]|nr:hypothetical protein [Chlorobiota bacterium]
MKYLLVITLLILINHDSTAQSLDDIKDLNIGDSTSVIINKTKDFEQSNMELRIDSIDYHVITIDIKTAPSWTKYKRDNSYNQQTGKFGSNHHQRQISHTGTETYAPFCLVIKNNILIDWGFIYELKRSDDKGIQSVGKQLDLRFRRKNKVEADL